MTNEELIDIIKDKEFFQEERCDDAISRFRIQQKLETLEQVEQSLMKILNALRTGYTSALEAASGNKYARVQPPLDPFKQWMVNNPDQVRRNAGYHVAIHPDKGIVARNSILLRLEEKVKELGLKDEVLITTIPDVTDDPNLVDIAL